MHEALVEDAEDDVDDEDGDQQQDAQPLLRRLKRLRRPGEAGGDRRGERLARQLVHLVDGGAERHARRQVERDRHRRHLARVRDAQRPDRVLEVRHVGERNHLAVARHEEVFQRAGIELRARHRLHHHPVLVGRACRSWRSAAGCTRWRARSRSSTATRPAPAPVGRSMWTMQDRAGVQQVRRHAAQHRLLLHLAEECRRRPHRAGGCRCRAG